MQTLDTDNLNLLGPGRPPPEIDAALKRIDPAAELLHLGGKKWWLGVRAPNPEAKEKGRLADAYDKASTPASSIYDPAERAVAQVELEKEFIMLQTMAGGFRPIDVYSVGTGDGEWTMWEIVEDFRIRDYNWRTQTEDQIRNELRKYASIEERNRPRIKRAGEWMKLKAGEVFRFAMKGARSILGADLE